MLFDSIRFLLKTTRYIVGYSARRPVYMIRVKECYDGFNTAIISAATAIASFYNRPKADI